MVRSRGEWYYVCFCRQAQGRRVFRVATTKRAALRDESFAPRPDLELDLYRTEGVPASEMYAPQTALVWYSREAARYVEERQPVDRLPDGACVARQPYVDDPWLVHYLLRFGGEARPLQPPEAAAALRATVGRLLARYGGA
jgi:predicted DNA-binding transcriptional regulator YafY